jgi:hypothetical protein
MRPRSRRTAGLSEMQDGRQASGGDAAPANAPPPLHVIEARTLLASAQNELPEFDRNGIVEGRSSGL